MPLLSFLSYFFNIILQVREFPTVVLLVGFRRIAMSASIIIGVDTLMILYPFLAQQTPQVAAWSKVIIAAP